MSPRFTTREPGPSGSDASHEHIGPCVRGSRAGGSNRKLRVLLAEDNPADVLLVEEAIEAHHVPIELLVVNDGEKAIQFIEEGDQDPDAPCLGMLLLDLNLPKRSGLDVLRRVRQSKKCRHIPVLILTSSDLRQDRAAAARLGADRYFRKPASYYEFIRVGEVLNELLARDPEDIR